MFDKSLKDNQKVYILNSQHNYKDIKIYRTPEKTHF